jgi:hypothetical protein
MSPQYRTLVGASSAFPSLWWLSACCSLIGPSRVSVDPTRVCAGLRDVASYQLSLCGVDRQLMYRLNGAHNLSSNVARCGPSGHVVSAGCKFLTSSECLSRQRAHDPRRFETPRVVVSTGLAVFHHQAWWHLLGWLRRVKCLRSAVRACCPATIESSCPILPILVSKLRRRDEQCEAGSRNHILREVATIASSKLSDAFQRLKQVRGDAPLKLLIQGCDCHKWKEEC